MLFKNVCVLVLVTKVTPALEELNIKHERKHWQLSCYLGWDPNPNSGKRQLAVSGNASDHTIIRADP